MLLLLTLAKILNSASTNCTIYQRMTAVTVAQ